jgi:hypothetical protein
MLKILCALTLLALFPFRAWAHPMDVSSLDVNVTGDRLKISLKLHALAAARFSGWESTPTDASKLSGLSAALFDATLGQATPVLGGDPCRWRTPALTLASAEPPILELTVIAVCTQARLSPFSLVFPLPFLKKARPSFQLVARIAQNSQVTTLIANAAKPGVDLGSESLKSFGGFLRMGMGHIGALPEEWKNREGGFRFPEGIDHICFVLALLLGGGSLLGLLKCVTGFTLGHSLTLALSALKVIHVHSRWVEAFIALSIAYVAGEALFRPRSSHRWAVAALFGTVHGLGFASALQELDLTGHSLFSALLGFNIGVELGQCLIIACVLPLLYGLKRFSPQAEVVVNRLAAAALLAVGSYWFLLRAIN